MSGRGILAMLGGCWLIDREGCTKGCTKRDLDGCSIVCVDTCMIVECMKDWPIRGASDVASFLATTAIFDKVKIR